MFEDKFHQAVIERLDQLILVEIEIRELQKKILEVLTKPKEEISNKFGTPTQP